MCHRSLAAIRGPTRSASIRIPTILVLGLSAPMCALAGCEAGSGADDAAAFTVRDSAGVTIAESTDSAWTDATRWRIAAEPDLVIGSVDGSVPGTDFGSVGQVVALDDAGIALSDRQTREVRVFGPDGAFRFALGGLGEGPDELGVVTAIGPAPGDSIAVFDGQSRKVVVYPLDPTGRGRDASTVPPDFVGVGFWGVEAWLDDGGWLMAHGPEPTDLATDAGVLDARWRRFGADGTLVDSLPSLPARQAYRHDVGGDGGDWVYPLVRPTQVVQGGRLWHGFPLRWEVRAIDLESGATERIVRLHRAREPVPESYRETFEIFQREALDRIEMPAAMRDTREALIRARVYADSAPAYRSFEVAPDGSIWIQEELSPRAPPPDSTYRFQSLPSRRWTVLDAEGRWLGTVDMPEGVEVHAIEADHVLGIREGELDVPFVVRYPILRPGS